jgi:hypothetical protein
VHRTKRFAQVARQLAGEMIGHPAQVFFDLDSTVLTVYGHQEKSAVGYNPKSPSHPPLLCFEGRTQTQDCWERNSAGNVHVSTVTIPLLERAFVKLADPSRRFACAPMAPSSITNYRVDREKARILRDRCQADVR